MALGNPALATPIPAAQTTSATTASFTPGAGEYLIVVAHFRQQNTVPASASISDSQGHTWSDDIPLQQINQGVNPRTGVAAWWTEATGASMTVTVTTGTTQAIHLHVLRGTKAAGSTLDLTNFNVGVSTTGDPAATLGTAPDAENPVVVSTYMAGTNTPPTPSGFTALSNLNSNGASLVAYDPSPAGSSAGFTTGNAAGHALLFEIKEVTGGGGITGTGSIAEDADTATATGALALSGAASATEGGDTIAAAGSLSVAGSAAVTEGADSAAGAGSLAISGAAATTEDADSVAASGAIAVTGTAAISEGADTAAAAGTLPIAGGATIAEGEDTAGAAGALAIAGAASATEGDDTIAAGGALPITGAGAATEDDDTLAASGGLAAAPGTGSVSVVEEADTVSAAGTLALAGSAAASEGDDAAAATGTLSIAGAGAMAEGADTAAAAGQIAIVGGLDTTEGADTVSAVGVSVVPAGPRAATGSRPTSPDFYAGRRPALAYGRRPVATAGGRRRR
jgi:hypothetical protein